MHTVSFAFCCFAFTAREANDAARSKSTNHSILEWATDVQSALESIPSVDNVRFTSAVTGAKIPDENDLFDRWGLSVLDVGRELQYYGMFAPHPTHGALSFDLTIPEVVRKRLLPFGVTRSENFAVRMWFRPRMPVCAIIGDDPMDSPVMTVPLVRQFLRDEFSRRVDQNRGIELESLPPSPMHLAGQVHETSNSMNRLFSMSLVPREGYDLLKVEVPRGSSSSQLDHVLESLVDEVALYYFLAGKQNYFADAERVLDAHSVALVAGYRATGVRAYLRRIFGGYKAAANMQIMAVEAEQARRAAVRSAIDARDRQISLSEQLVLQRWIDSEIDGLHQSSAPEIERMSALVTAGTNHSVQAIAVVASAGLGGAVGAALTALLT